MKLKISKDNDFSFQAKLHKALKAENYLAANKLIEKELEKAGTSKISKATKHTIVNEIFKSSNGREYSIGMFDTADKSVEAINQKIIEANPESKITIENLTFNLEELAQGENRKVFRK